MYCVAVCEDDPRTAEQNKIAVCRVLNGRGRVQGRDYDVEVFHAATPLMERLTANSNAYQLLLLDIQLDGDDGVEMARFLREHQINASIIYITDHPGFALDSFPTYPLEYLLKPVDEERLAAALDWDWQQRHIRPKRPVMQVGSRVIPLDEIIYLETSGRKTAIHTQKDRIEYTVPLSKLKEEFQKQGFCLSHFSYLVNLAHVARVERDALTLDTGESIPVSRRYYQDFMARYVESLK
ncbi:Sensory transduction protein lytR [uncultured Clostridium sp.]|uniref:Stage 0 sporulation protein A homolog n=1 Tax=Flintibacter hominis TaxID=2763048 RepID=A0A8J6JAU5_9FIRM|nr:response regulator transcription factor [Flintibacter hominis]MBC5723133.1 response regulator transcription factor [Flintibacter hominis]SCH18379.1 Sensory transduction protein lytR [uncultured Clostridium sp.]